ncbi:hypothetical protein CVT26_011139 [Gymnopilus dilepis]|uniref:Uncharacterized protein n=1 Tax=Gymnopilus dilepis TaxID=231916 RepID=A0A409VYU4_9AGAR|nr:hypothetical protein CVT26_011139 [Gymnopilus dilepis]
MSSPTLLAFLIGFTSTSIIVAFALLVVATIKYRRNRHQVVVPARVRGPDSASAEVRFIIPRRALKTPSSKHNSRRSSKAKRNHHRPAGSAEAVELQRPSPHAGAPHSVGRAEVRLSRQEGSGPMPSDIEVPKGGDSREPTATQENMA